MFKIFEQISPLYVSPHGKEHSKHFSIIGWLLVDKSTPISDQESPAVGKSVLCNAICLNPEFLQVQHLDKLSEAQGTFKIT